MNGHLVDLRYPLTFIIQEHRAPTLQVFSSSHVFLSFSYLIRDGLVQYFPYYMNNAWFQMLYHQTVNQMVTISLALQYT